MELVVYFKVQCYTGVLESVYSMKSI